MSIMQKLLKIDWDDIFEDVNLKFYPFSYKIDSRIKRPLNNYIF